MTIFRQSLMFGSLCAISLVIWGRTLFATFSLAVHNDEYTHILLILPVSLALIFSQKGLWHESARPNIRLGAFCLLVAALVTLWGKWQFGSTRPDIALSVGMLGVVAWWIGAVIFCFGTHAFRSNLFPLLFLLWLVPFPAFVLDSIVSLLQHSSAWLTRFFFDLAGVPVRLNGVVLSIPEVDIEVAKECSSIRSSLMLMVATMVMAHLSLRSGWRQALLVIAAVPLSVFKNAVRIFTLSMLATHVDPGFLSGDLHHRGGIVFFLLALGIICLLTWLLQDTRSDTNSSQIRPRTAESPAANL